MISHIIGREEPLGRLDDFVRVLGEGPSSLVIEGEAGIGKTTVWQAAVDAAAERGFRVLSSRPAETETALAYSGLADLLANVDAAVFGELPEPQRRALEVALLIAEPSGRSPEPRAVYTAFGGVLRTLAGGATVLIAVDDLQWLDRSSLRALEFASRRIAHEPVGSLATARLGSPDPPTLPGASVLRLGALSPAALHQLVKAQVGVNLLRPAVLRIHRMTGGNPFFALELARLLVAADLPGSSDPWPVPDDLRELVSARVGRLPNRAASALLEAAAGGTTTISGLTGSALRTAEREAIVTVGRHGQVRFAHPLFASANRPA